MAGIDQLKHIVVLMMENRSFDHMLGGLTQKYPKINGLTGNESNPDTNGAIVKVQHNAEFQSQLDPDPDHHFPVSIFRFLVVRLKDRGAWPICRGS